MKYFYGLQKEHSCSIRFKELWKCESEQEAVILKGSETEHFSSNLALIIRLNIVIYSKSWILSQCLTNTQIPFQIGEK